MTVRRTLAALAVVLLLPGVGLAAPGDLDTTFSQDGWVAIDLSAATEFFYAMDLVGDGGYACGNSDQRIAVVRFKPNGGPVDAFGGDGVVTTSFPGGASVNDCVVLADGRVAVVGSVYSDPAALAVVVYREDGGRSRAFSGDGRLLLHPPDLERAYGYAIAQQPDGRLVVAGQSRGSAQPERWNAIAARLHLDGRLDRSFNGDGWYVGNVSPGDDAAWRMALDGHGRIVLAGWTEMAKGTSVYDSLFIRLKPGGKPDPTFGGDGVVVRDLGGGDESDYALGLDLRGNDAPVASVFVENTGLGRVVRMTPKGRLDAAFAGDGVFDVPIVSPFRGQEVDLVTGLGVVLTGFITSGPTPIVAVVRNDGAGMRMSFGEGGFSLLGDCCYGGRFYAGEIDTQGRLVAVGGAPEDLLVARLQT